MQTGLKKRWGLISGALILLLSGTMGAWSFAGEQGPEYKRGFSEGYTLAVVQLNEDVIMNTYGMLDLLLAKHSNCKTLENQMVLWGINTPLVDISKQLAAVGKVRWSQPFQEHARITSLYLRKFMRNLSQARIKNGWRHEDPAMEARIQAVLATYRKYGNPFRIEADRQGP